MNSENQSFSLMPHEQFRGGQLQVICAAIKNCGHIVVQLLQISSCINHYICSMVGIFPTYEPFIQARCEMFTLAFSPEFQLQGREFIWKEKQADIKRSNKTEVVVFFHGEIYLTLNKTNWSLLTVFLHSPQGYSDKVKCSH